MALAAVQETDSSPGRQVGEGNVEMFSPCAEAISRKIFWELGCA